MKSIIRILTSLLIVWSLVNAQIPQERKYDPNKVVRNALEAAVYSKYGNNFKASYHIMDSLIANSFLDEIVDPYHTLAGCVLFSARPGFQSKDSVVTGIYKNGQIIWDDYPGSKAGFGGMLLAVRDINNDGIVEILQAEPDFDLRTREGSGISYLWILSWNGTTASIINSVDPNTHQSTLVSTDNVYELIDANRNGIFQIRGQIDSVWQSYFPDHNTVTLPYITYGWNGSLYGFWGTVRQVSENDFLPANLLEATMKCTVTKNGDQFSYEYKITNGSTSEQRLECFYIGGVNDSSSQAAPDHWIASSSSYIGGRYFYSSIGKPQFTLKPGETRNGYKTISTGFSNDRKILCSGIAHILPRR